MDFISIVINQSALLGFAVLLVVAALSDMREFTIPNRVNAAIALLYPAHVMSSATPIDWPMAIVIAAIVLLVCAGLFAIGGMGGGDAKMLAATSLWAGPGLVLPFIIITTVVGGLLSLVVWMRVRFGPMVGLAVIDSRPVVPYGVAIATSGLLVVYTLFLS